MIHLGIDLHKNFSFITAMDEQGHVLGKSKVLNQREAFSGFLASYPPGHSQVVLEPTWNWYWLWDFLEERGYQIQLAHPLKTKAIAKVAVARKLLRTIYHLLREQEKISFGFGQARRGVMVQ